METQFCTTHTHEDFSIEYNFIFQWINKFRNVFRLLFTILHIEYTYSILCTCAPDNDKKNKII